MPGFYVSQQSSGIGSGLASAIAQIADNFSPKTQAQAEELRQQTENLKWGNFDNSIKVPAKLHAVQQMLGLPQTTDSEVYNNQSGSPLAGAAAKLTVNPSMPQGGNAYVPPTPGHPEDQRGGVDYSRAGAIGTLAANAIAQGQSADDALKYLYLGQNIIHGPGQDIGTLAASNQAIRTATLSPYTISADQYRVAPTEMSPQSLTPSWLQQVQTQQGHPPQPQPQVAAPAPTPAPAPASTGGGPTQPSVAAPAPSVGGGGTPTPVPLGAGLTQVAPGITAGPSGYVKSAQEAGGTAAATEFAQDGQKAEAAGKTLAVVNHMMDLYGSVIHDNSPGDQIANNVVDGVSNFLGGNVVLPGKQAARMELAKTATRLIGEIRSTMGINRVTQYEFQKFQGMLASGDMPATMFYDMMNDFKASLMQQQQVGAVANTFDNTQESAKNIRAQKQAIDNADLAEALKRGYPSVMPQNTPAQTMEGQTGTFNGVHGTVRGGVLIPDGAH